MQAFYDNNTKYINIFYIPVAFQSRLNNCFQKNALLIAILAFCNHLCDSVYVRFCGYYILFAISCNAPKVA